MAHFSPSSPPTTTLYLRAFQWEKLLSAIFNSQAYTDYCYTEPEFCSCWDSEKGAHEKDPAAASSTAAVSHRPPLDPKLASTEKTNSFPGAATSPSLTLVPTQRIDDGFRDVTAAASFPKSLGEATVGQLGMTPLPQQPTLSPVASEVRHLDDVVRDIICSHALGHQAG